MKGCDNCYYEYFDSRAYPCSLCIRGIKRTDKWMPSKKTKDEIQKDCFLCKWLGEVDVCGRCRNRNLFAEKGEPQTDNGIGCSRCESRHWCYDRDKPNAKHCNNYGKITDEPQTESLPWWDAFDAMDCQSR